MNWRLIFFFWPVSPELQEIKKHAIAFSKQVKQTTTRYHTKGLGSRGDPALSDPAPPSQTPREVEDREPANAEKPQVTRTG